MIQPDLRAATITLDHGGVSENTYGARDFHLELPRMIFNRLVTAFPAVLEEDRSEWELLGITQPNSDNYQTETVSVFYFGPPPNFRRSAFGIPFDMLLVDAHTIKYELMTGKTYIKVYQGDWWNIPLPSLPSGSCVATNFGVGRHFGKQELSSRRDIYFFHESAAVEDWIDRVSLKQVTSQGIQLSSVGLYGLQFDSESLIPLRIKRYFHPHEPVISDRLNL